MLYRSILSTIFLVTKFKILKLTLMSMVTQVSSNAFVVTRVRVSVFAHATEDEEKVEQALRNIIPRDVGDLRIDTQRLTGYYHDPITIVNAVIRKNEAATKLFCVTIKSLPPLDQQRLLEEVEERVDKAGVLYLRLDKQGAFRNKRVLNEVDPILMRFRFRIPHGANPVSYVRSSITAVINEV